MHLFRELCKENVWEKLKVHTKWKLKPFNGAAEKDWRSLFIKCRKTFQWDRSSYSLWTAQFLLVDALTLTNLCNALTFESQWNIASRGLQILACLYTSMVLTENTFKHYNIFENFKHFPAIGKNVLELRNKCLTKAEHCTGKSGLKIYFL